MKIFDEIMNRIRSIEGYVNDITLASQFEVSQQAFSNWKIRDNIPIQRLAKFAESKNINLHWLLSGEGDQYTKIVQVDTIGAGFTLNPVQLQINNDTQNNQNTVDDNLIKERDSEEIIKTNINDDKKYIIIGYNQLNSICNIINSLYRDVTQTKEEIRDLKKELVDVKNLLSKHNK